MKKSDQTLLAVLVAAGGGAAGAGMSVLNGQLGESGTGPFLAALLSYIGTLIVSVIIFALRGKALRTWELVRTQGSWWWFAVGLFAVPIVVGFAWGIPLIGVALASVCVVAGQSVASLTLDAYGIGSRQAVGVTPRRLIAVVLALVGLVIAATGGSEYGGGAGAVLAALVLFIAGALSVGNQAGSGKIVGLVKDPFIAAITTSAGGFVGIALIVLGMFAFGTLQNTVWPTEWWLYLGGLLGFLAGVAGAFSVRHLGTFVLSITTLGGQMATGLIVDAFSPIGVHIPTLAATAAVILASLIAIQRNSKTATTDKNIEPSSLVDLN